MTDFQQFDKACMRITAERKQPLAPPLEHASVCFRVVLFLRFFQLQFCFNESCCLVISIIIDDNISAAIRAVHGGLSANEAAKNSDFHGQRSEED